MREKRVKNPIVRIGVREKKHQGLPGDWSLRAQGGVRRSVGDRASGSADLGVRRPSLARRPQAAGVGLLLRGSWTRRPGATCGFNVLETSAVSSPPPSPPQPSSPVRWAAPVYLEQKPGQMENYVQKLDHRTSRTDSQRSWTTRERLMQLTCASALQLTDLELGRKPTKPSSLRSSSRCLGGTLGHSIAVR